MWYSGLLEKGYIPDSLIRRGIRGLLAMRLRQEDKNNAEAQQQHLHDLVAELRKGSIAVNTQEANEQHYELPTEFYQYCLGARLKYSSAYWKPGVSSLDQAEEDMLALYLERAELTDGQDILELGCGWGSLTLYMAEKLPGSKITAVSNSRTQKIHIDAEARKRGFDNLHVITADINDFSTDKTFDRVVSVEMFEHMRNHYELLKLVAGVLKDNGKLFIHIFVHKIFTYLFEVVDETDWMAKYFFTGGIMPGDHYMHYFPEHLIVAKHWHVNGTNYQKTAEAWLDNMDAHKAQIMPLFKDTYGNEAVKWWNYWRIFYMSCAELWGYRNGSEWFVSHYLFEKR